MSAVSNGPDLLQRWHCPLLPHWDAELMGWVISELIGFLSSVSRDLEQVGQSTMMTQTVKNDWKWMSWTNFHSLKQSLTIVTFAWRLSIAVIWSIYEEEAQADRRRRLSKTLLRKPFVVIGLGCMSCCWDKQHARSIIALPLSLLRYYCLT